MQIANSLNEVMIETYRRRHLAYLMADQGALVGNPEAAPNLPKQHLARRQVKKNKSVIQLLLFNETNEDDIKCKNIKQTEILVDLREAILQVRRHFLKDLINSKRSRFRLRGISCRLNRNYRRRSR